MYIYISSDIYIYIYIYITNTKLLTQRESVTYIYIYIYNKNKDNHTERVWYIYTRYTWTNKQHTNKYLHDRSKGKVRKIGNPVPHPLGSGKNTKVSPWLAHASLFSSTTSRRLVAGQTSGGENYEAKLPVTTPMVNTKDVPGNHTYCMVTGTQHLSTTWMEDSVYYLSYLGSQLH